MTENGLHDFYLRYIAALNAHEFGGMDEFIADKVLLGGEMVHRTIASISYGERARLMLAACRCLPAAAS